MIRYLTISVRGVRGVRGSGSLLSPAHLAPPVVEEFDAEWETVKATPMLPLPAQPAPAFAAVPLAQQLAPSAPQRIIDKPLISVGVKGRQGVLVLLGACRYYKLIFYRGKRPRTLRTHRILKK